MAKRKRDIAAVDAPAASAKAPKSKKLDSQAATPGKKSKELHTTATTTTTPNQPPSDVKNQLQDTIKGPTETPLSTDTATFQIITGSYERVLHGFAAAIPKASLVTGPHQLATSEGTTNTTTTTPTIDFTDTFLFNAHSSAIRCLALSPPSDESSKITLATGSTDERINIYSLSTAPPPPTSSKTKLPTLHGNSIAENSKNKELGSLLHHSSNITALYFPSRSKFLSSAEDSTIAITRTRDWTPLSTIKAPIPKPQGRPSGDTAGPGEVPSGINDFAVHPSMKLMVSVGKGEKCMRLWNLVTGKKAGVLNFGRDILTAVGEGRFGSGEGRRVVWDAEGEEFAVAFERGVMLFGIDCKPKARIVPSPRTKIHQVHYLPLKSTPGTLLVSTEDGRIIIYDTSNTSSSEDLEKSNIPSSKLIAQLGGPAAGISGRIKDFEILTSPGGDDSTFLIITGSSDGTVRLWSVNVPELMDNAEKEKGKGFAAKQVGRLLGNYSTGTRITCLKAYAMTGAPDEVEEQEEVEQPEDSSSSDSE